MVLITSHSFSPSVTFLFPPFFFSVFSLFFLCFLQALLSQRSPNGQHRSQVPTKPTSENPNLFLGAQICLRILAVASTLTATLIILTSKQSIEIIGMTLAARYSYSPAFKFFALANAIACAFSAISLFMVFFLRRLFFNPANYFILFLHDLFLLSLVLSGCAAATAIGYVGQYGNDHAGWAPICDHFHKYCKRVTTSAAFSYLAVLFLLVLTVLSASKSRQIQV